MTSIPSGEDRRRNLALVNETLTLLGIQLDKPEQALTDEQKAIRRLLEANREATLKLFHYYNQHPLATNLPELRKIIMSVYQDELIKWSKDDMLFMLVIQQTQLFLKKFGYGS